MFDHGYVGVDPSYRLRVSPRLRSEFGNGDSFYAKAGQVITLAERGADRPNPDGGVTRMRAWIRQGQSPAAT